MEPTSFSTCHSYRDRKLSLTFDRTVWATAWTTASALAKTNQRRKFSDVKLAVDHPHGTWNFTSNTLVNTNWHDQIVTKTYQPTNASYVLAYAC